MRRRAVPEGIRITKVGVWYVVLTLLVAVPAANTGNNGLYMVEAALLGVLVVSGLVSRANVRRLTVELEPPGELYAGEPASLGLRVTNRSRFFARRLIELRGPVGDDAALVPHLAPGAARHVTVGFTPARRGRLALRNAHLASLYPLGLFRKGQRYRLAAEALVYPRILPAGEVRSPRGAAGEEERALKVGRGHELFSLRSFRPGDDPRGIHWKQTARTGSLVYLEREADEGKRLSVVLDNGVGSLAAGVEERFERLVSEAASAAHHHLARGWEVELILRGHRVAFGRGAAHRSRLLEALALVEPVASRTEPLAPADPTATTLVFALEAPIRRAS